jgi:MFS family permease
MLCSAVFQPLFALLALFGQKLTILSALAFFTVGSLTCALAHNAATLVAGRCIQGIGGGGLIILTYVLMAHLFTLQERAKYTSIIGLIWTVGTICGPVIGGGFAEVSWAS